MKRLEMQGFKSFADKTSMVFKPGVTAIVGPNGCGKSNIVDAIKWVLGESNARSLRGELMEDVIFSGSDDSGPLGMAEVSLSIVNDDGVLPIEYSEVTVKRRLYRSGESEFILNKNNVRLRDIQELFADTGIGKTSYSVMEQGNIDQILSNKPEERMSIFEEAAGITRYKMKIKESHRKLDATRQNLERLNLIISEVEKEYNNLEKQAQKAVQYKNLKKQEIKYETLCNYLKVHSLRQKLNEKQKELSRLRETKNKIKKEVEEINSTINQKINHIRKIENKIVEIRNEVYRKDADLETINSKISHTQDRLHEIENEIAKKRSFIQKSNSRKQQLEKKQEKLKIEKQNTENLLSSHEEKLTGYTSEIQYIDGLIEECNQNIKQNQEKAGEVEHASADLRKQLKQVVDKLVEEIDHIKARYKGEEKKKNQLVEGIFNSIDQMESELKHLGTKLGDLVFSYNGTTKQSFIQNLSDEIEQLKQKAARLKENVQTVIDIQDELSRVMFGEQSLHYKKEQIEKSIENALLEYEELKNHTEELNQQIKYNREKKESFQEMVVNLRSDLARNRERIKYLQENMESIKSELLRNEESIDDVHFEIRTLDERKSIFKKDIQSLESEYSNIEQQKNSISQELNTQNALIDGIVREIKKSESEAAQKRSRLEQINTTIEQSELRNAEISSKIETIIENFKERYGISLEIYQPEEDLASEEVSKKREEIKNQIQRLGNVNLMAIQECEEIKKRYQYHMAQKQDLERAQQDLNDLISGTLQSSRERFMQSFEKIQSNFDSIFKRLFNGGTTSIFLTNESNIFDSGVELLACPPGKSLKRRSLLSGGEKGLTAIALLFSIFMVRPSPFCLLDEVDHDLDEENVLRFLKLLKEFTETTQFIIITHNRRTLEFADIIYGITSERAGISKVVSLEMVENAIE
ncbi:MAG: chromosome segregation SMC family protein [Spirochaetota bacterium]